MNEQYRIQIIKSRRKTISLQIRPDGTILVKAPNRVSNRYIREFIASHQSWIDKQLKKMEQVQKALCHRKEMNHSRKFYEEVLKVFPEYHTWDRWLKRNGTAILSR